MDTMTTHQLGQAPGRARRGASAAVSCWPMFAVAQGIAFTTNAYVGNTTDPAGAEHLSFTKRHTRHLTVRTT